MAVDVVLPELGEGVDSGDVLEILVSEGDQVTRDQGLLELETDKATVTVPSEVSGTVSKILVTVGQTVAKGEVVVQIEAGDSAPAAAPAPATPEPAPAPPAPAPAPAAPEPTQAAQPAPTPPPATPAPETPPPSAAPAPAPAAPAAPATSPSTPVAASPSVKRFAREVGVDLAKVTGTEAGGRISREDVLRAVREASSRPANPSTAMTKSSAPVASPVGGNKAIALPGEPGHNDYGPVRVERLSKIRKTIANQMHKSWETVPRVTNFDDADVTDLEALRRSSKEDYAAEGIKLTTMPFLIKAVSSALRAHPTINGKIDLENDQVTYHDYVNVGIAVDTDRGLVVPNIRNSDSMSIPDIARALDDLAKRVRGGDFGVNELRGGTFTISNMGSIGGCYSTPIVNVPEVAILLVGRTRKLPVVMPDDSIQAREMMPLSLSYDHRLVDGGTASRFLNDVIAYLEAPSRLLLAIN